MNKNVLAELSIFCSTLEHEFHSVSLVCEISLYAWGQMALIKNYPWVRYGIRIPQIKAGLRQEIKNSQLKKYPIQRMPWCLGYLLKTCIVPGRKEKSTQLGTFQHFQSKSRNIFFSFFWCIFLLHHRNWKYDSTDRF